MILYYPTKFHFNTVKSFRVMGLGHNPPPPPPLHPPNPRAPMHPKKQGQDQNSLALRMIILVSNILYRETGYDYGGGGGGVGEGRMNC